MALKKEASSDGEEDEVPESGGEEAVDLEKGAEPDAGADPQIYTMTGAQPRAQTTAAPLPWQRGAGPAGAPQGAPNWGALAQRFGGGGPRPGGMPPAAQTGPAPGNAMPWGHGGMMGGGGGWLHQLAQRLAQRGGGGGQPMWGQGPGGNGPRPGGWPGMRR